MAEKVEEIVRERAQQAVREAFEASEGTAAAQACARRFAAHADTATTQISEIIDKFGAMEGSVRKEEELLISVAKLQQSMGHLTPKKEQATLVATLQEKRRHLKAEERQQRIVLEALEELKSAQLKATRGLTEEEEKRAQVYGTARELIMSEYHSSVQVGRENTEPREGKGKNTEAAKETPLQRIPNVPLYQFPLCEVTIVTKKLTELMENTLAKAFSGGEENGGRQGSTEEAAELVRRTVHLWRILVPQTHGQLIEQVPRVAALYHNDCLFLSHWVSMLPLRYPIHMLSPIHQRRFAMLDLVETLRSSGTVALKGQLSQQMDQLTDSLLSTGGFSRSNEPERKKELSHVLERICYETKKLKKAWEGVLPAAMLELMLGRIVNAVLKSMMYQVEELKDLSEAETVELHALFKSMLSLASLFERGDVSSMVSSWKRYKDVCAMFNMSMVGIVEKYKAGDLADFTRYEIRHWIKALFSDSAFRQKNLEQII